MSNYNSIPPYIAARVKDNSESIGITQQGVDEDHWYQIIGGLIIQGGIEAVDANTIDTVPFVQPFPKKVLGVWLQTIGNGTLPAPAIRNYYAEIIDLATFELSNDYAVESSFYWLAIGY